MIKTYMVYKKNAYIYTIFLSSIARKSTIYFFFRFFFNCLKISGEKIFTKYSFIGTNYLILFLYNSVNKNILFLLTILSNSRR